MSRRKSYESARGVCAPTWHMGAPVSPSPYATYLCEVWSSTLCDVEPSEVLRTTPHVATVARLVAVRWEADGWVKSGGGRLAMWEPLSSDWSIRRHVDLDDCAVRRTDSLTIEGWS